MIGVLLFDALQGTVRGVGPRGRCDFAFGHLGYDTIAATESIYYKLKTPDSVGSTDFW